MNGQDILKSPVKGKATPVAMRGTPRKRHLSSTDVELSSPRKCPASPGPSRAGLRSTTPKKVFPDSVENSANPVKSPGKCDTQHIDRTLPSSPNKAASEKLVLPQESKYQRPPIVIILEDFESFNSIVLQDFITICRLVNQRSF
jgi:Origin recognition complex (ORC) subunit 3 N-terminus